MSGLPSAFHLQCGQIFGRPFRATKNLEEFNDYYKVRHPADGPYKAEERALAQALRKGETAPPVEFNVEVQGEHHLWAHRPSVFMFNHQSILDGYVLLHLLRRGFTGIAKQEAAKMPLLGQILRGLDFAFIDRSNSRNAIETMKPAVDRLRLGMSVVIAPEGTRSLTPRLGRFKKGAFHMAMQADAAVVPVVIRNSYQVMTRGSLLFRPGTVQVCVLPPVDVATWKVEDLDRHVAEVQALFQRTLDDWPTAGRG